MHKRHIIKVIKCCAFRLDHQPKLKLVLGRETIVVKQSNETFLVVGHQVIAIISKQP